MEIKDKILKGKPLTQEERVELVREIERLKANQKDKRYGLVWENHPEDVELMRETHVYNIEELKELEIKKVKGQKPNLILEGDNLHSLEVLRDSGVKVDVIYIDPPYNTLNETGFAYNDKKIDSNDNFRHSKWLSFMEKRLKLARELMEDDGVIFVSIDDNEQAQLKLLCDSIFGERNFISNMVWKNKSGGGHDSKHIVNEHEYVLLYSKDKQITKLAQKPQEGTNYKEKDERGNYRLEKMDRTSLGYLESLDFPITLEGKTAICGGTKEENKKQIWRWRWGKESVEWGIKEGVIVVKENREGVICAYNKVYENYHVDARNKKIIEIDIKTNPYRSMLQGLITTQGTEEVEGIFRERVFEYPKPVNLIKQVIKLKKKDSVILDFFAGSGTTGHAVMELNKEDGGNRRFILCTNNEYQESKKVDIIHKHTDIVIDTKKNGEPSVKGKKELEEFETTEEYQDLVERGLFEEIGICRAVTYERNKRVIEGYTTPKGKEVEGIPNNLKYYKVGLIPKEEISEYNYLNYNAERLEREIEIKKGMPSFEDKGFYSESELDGLKVVIIKEIFVPKELIEDLRKYEGNIIIYVSKDIQNIDYNLQELKREKGSKLGIRGIKEKIK